MAQLIIPPPPLPMAQLIIHPPPLPPPKLYPLLVATAFTVIVSVGKDPRFVLPSTALAAAGIIHCLWLGVPLEFWAHVLFGVLCVAAGAIAARTGRSVCVELWQGSAAVLVFTALIIGEYLSVGFGRLHYVAHGLLELSCLLFTLSASAERLVYACSVVYAPAAVLCVHQARIVMDPCCLACIGIILMAHRHDPAPIAVMFHHVQSALLLVLALGVGATAATFAKPAAACSVSPALRALHTLCWVVNGLWLLAMAMLMYLSPGRRGLHHAFYPTADAAEAVAIYFALTLLCSAVVVAVMTANARDQAVQSGTNRRQDGQDDGMTGMGLLSGSIEDGELGAR